MLNERLLQFVNYDLLEVKVFLLFYMYISSFNITQILMCIFISVGWMCDQG